MSVESTLEEKCEPGDAGKKREKYLRYADYVVINYRLNHVEIFLASIVEEELVENLEEDGNVPLDFTEKFYKICYDLRGFEGLLRASKSDYSKEQATEVTRFKERLDKYFYEITNSKDPPLFDDVIFLAESFVCMYRITLLKCTVDTEQSVAAEFFLTRSMTLLEGKELDRKAIVGSIVILNELARAYMSRELPLRTLQYLNKALDLYIAYTKGEDKFPAPINMLTIVGI